MIYELDEQLEQLLGPTRGTGVNAMFHCPFGHEDRHPSLSVHRDEGLFYCFSCGSKGNLEQLYRQLGEELDEEQRYTLLARSVFREPEQPPNFAALANRHRRELSGAEGRVAWKLFAKSRDIRDVAADHFNVGYSPEKRALAFPYWTDDGKVTGIKYRHRDGSKTSESGGQRSIYNVSDIIGAPVILLCEGESDTIAAWSVLHGRNTTAVAVCGSPGAGVSEKTWANWGVDFLFARTIYVAFDGDDAGSKGGETAMRVLGGERCVRIIPTRGKDLAEHILKGGSLGELGVAETND